MPPVPMASELDDEDDIRADLQEAFEALRDGRVGDDGMPLERDDKDTADEDKRQRDAGGRFAQKEGDDGDKPAGAEQKPADAEPGAEDKPAQPAQAAAEDIPAPASWSQSPVAAQWATLPPDVRKFVSDREAGFADSYRTLAEPLRPVAELAQARGIPWQQGLSQLVEAQREFDKSPTDGLLFLAKKFGLDLDDIAEMAYQRGVAAAAGGTPPSQQHVNPQQEERLRRLETSLEQQAREREEAGLQENLQVVHRFAQANPHFDALKDEIKALMPLVKSQKPGASREEVLKEAYDRACFANPAIRSQIQAAAVKTQQTQQQQQQRTRGSRLASSLSHVGGPTNGAIQRQPMKNGRFDDDDIKNDILASVDSLSS